MIEWIDLRHSNDVVVMEEGTIVKCVAIGGLVVIVVVASLNGIDGALIGAICAIIGGIAGYTAKLVTSNKEK